MESEIEHCAFLPFVIDSEEIAAAAPISEKGSLADSAAEL